MRDNTDTLITLPWALLAVVLGVFLALSLHGCATQQSALEGFQASAIRDLHRIQDNTLATTVTVLCDTPLSALVRNNSAIPAVKALCLPAGEGSSPVSLLDSVAPQQALTPSVLNAAPIGSILTIPPAKVSQ